MERIPYTLSQKFALAASTDGTAWSIIHTDAKNFICDEKDVVVTLTVAVAPFPINYPVARAGAQRGLTSGETNLPALDMVEINTSVRSQEFQKPGAYVPAGAYAARDDRGLQRTGFSLAQNDEIKGKMNNKSAVALTVEIIFKGYIEV